MPPVTEPLSDAIGYGLASARTAASVAGRLYYATDTTVLSRDNGTSWDVLSVGGAPASLIIPVGTGSLATTEGAIGWHSSSDFLRMYDDSQEIGIGERGWAPYGLQVGFDSGAALTSTVTIAANGGSLAIPMVVPAHMKLRSVTVRNVATTTARTWGWDLYVQRHETASGSQNTLDRVAQSTADQSFTPAAASNQTIAASGAPVYLSPGLYWLVIQSRHATSTFLLGGTAVSTVVAALLNMGQLKTTTNPNGSTLDFVAATWTKDDAVYGAVLNGDIFGTTGPF